VRNNEKTNMQKRYSVVEACAIAGFSVPTLYRYWAAGTGPASIHLGGRRYIGHDELVSCAAAPVFWTGG
jgi:predicted DNA-binding transcriptional regulator AlpA